MGSAIAVAYTEARTKRDSDLHYSDRTRRPRRCLDRWHSSQSDRGLLDKIANGWSPEEIHFQHPCLSLAQIHGALTYYYENQAALDEQIRQGLEQSSKLAEQLCDADFRRKLAAMKRDR